MTKQEEDGWIKVQSEVDLPENFTNVYVRNKAGNIFICASRSTGFWCCTNNWFYDWDEITHYQLIPIPDFSIY